MFVAAALVLIPVSLLLYQNNIVRWVFIGVVVVAAGIVAYLKRKEILRMISQFRKGESRNGTNVAEEH
jgi:hypothetical protein